MTYLLKVSGVQGVSVASAGVSWEEHGNPVHRGTRRVLAEHGIPLVPHTATALERADYDRYDLFVCADELCERKLNGILGRSDKTKTLLSYAGENRDVADPWYTGDFDATYEDCLLGLTALLQTLKEE